MVIFNSYVSLPEGNSHEAISSFAESRRCQICQAFGSSKSLTSFAASWGQPSDAANLRDVGDRDEDLEPGGEARWAGAGDISYISWEDMARFSQCE